MANLGVDGRSGRNRVLGCELDSSGSGVLPFLLKKCKLFEKYNTLNEY
jgi:hypothetical protein